MYFWVLICDYRTETLDWEFRSSDFKLLTSLLEALICQLFLWKCLLELSQVLFEFYFRGDFILNEVDPCCQLFFSCFRTVELSISFCLWRFEIGFCELLLLLSVLSITNFRCLLVWLTLQSPSLIPKLPWLCAAFLLFYSQLEIFLLGIFWSPHEPCWLKLALKIICLCFLSIISIDLLQYFQEDCFSIMLLPAPSLNFL